jgi:hypothetical protein
MAHEYQTYESFEKDNTKTNIIAQMRLQKASDPQQYRKELLELVEIANDFGDPDYEFKTLLGEKGFERQDFVDVLTAISENPALLDQIEGSITTEKKTIEAEMRARGKE